MMEFLETHNLTGLAIGLATFLIIGIFHPLVIKGEYYWGMRCRWAFAAGALLFGVLALLTSNVLTQALLGVTAFSCLWSIHEVNQQRERVRKGWFPRNPGRQYDSSYDPPARDDHA